MKRILIYGNASMAGHVYHELTMDMPYEVIAFTVDRDSIEEYTILERPVVPFDEVVSIYPPDECDMFIAVGYTRINKLRAERYHQAKEMGYRLINYVSPASRTGPRLEIGDNCHIGPYSVINPSAKIGNDVFIGVGAVIAHDAVIGDHCFLADHVIVPGFVVVEPYCYLGPNVTLRNKVTIARECVIGAGAVILEDTEERGVYMANTARQLPISSDRLHLA